MLSLSTYTRLCLLAVAVAMCVVVLGAYVRLSNAGLSCPDWPGCYGQLVVPDPDWASADIARAFPDRPLDPARAWKEMIHRYLAGVLGLVIFALAALAWRRRRMPGQRVGLPLALAVLVVVQALLGMWTVTLLLKPVVVLAHLLGGLATLAGLWWLALRQGRIFAPPVSVGAGGPLASVRPWVLLGLVVLVTQIALGGWTSANYAALACTDFPLCQGVLIPDLHLVEALRPWGRVGQSYEGGVLSSEARVTIHVMHRIGALVTLLYLGGLALWLSRAGPTAGLAAGGALVLVLLLVQVGLGVANVLLALPIEVAVAHHGTAALLLLSLVAVYHMALPARATL
jgi:cytochrome c oxidase assembly protein subunit 15